MLMIVVLGLPLAIYAQQTRPTLSGSDAVPAAQMAQPSPTPSQVAPADSAAPFGEIDGTVKSGNIPLPGVAVTAANTLTGKKYLTSTDVDGTFKVSVTGKGRYVVRAEFSAFAPVTQEILINEQNRSGKAELAMVLLSRAQKDAQQEQRQQMAQQLATAGRGGMQQLALSGGGGDIGGEVNDEWEWT